MASIPKLPTINDDDPLFRRVLYQGEGSATADKEALARAKAMKDAGEGDAKIWKETGWYPGKDGKWRSEINDENAKLRDGIEQQLKDQLANHENKSYRVRDFLDHDELLEAYPAIADMQVNANIAHPMGASVLGQYKAGVKPSEDDDPKLRAFFALRPDAGSPRVLLNLTGASHQADIAKMPFGEAVRLILLHEIQRHLQHEEGFSDEPKKKNGKRTPYLERPHEQEAYDVNERSALGSQRRREILPWMLEHGSEGSAYPLPPPPDAAAPSPKSAPEPAPGANGPLMQTGVLDAPSLSPIRHFLGDHDHDETHFRDAYAYDHGVPGYLDMHFALLHPSTPSDLARQHLQAANGMATADSAPDNESEPDKGR